VINIFRKNLAGPTVAINHFADPKVRVNTNRKKEKRAAFNTKMSKFFLFFLISLCLFSIKSSIFSIKFNYLNYKNLLCKIEINMKLN